MKQNRRTFLKTAGALGATALAAGATGARPQQAQAQAVSAPFNPPKGLTLATLKRANGHGLGIRTAKGILDVAAAAPALKENVPTTIDALFRGEGDAAGLNRLVDKALAGAPKFFVEEAKATFDRRSPTPKKSSALG